LDPHRALFLGETYVRLKRAERALQVLEHASAEDAFTWLWRSNALNDLHRDEEAVECAHRGLALDPESPYLHLVLARAEIARNRGRFASPVR
jgi:predicted Zn-dependent protease